ncbi:hypothetical protein Goshw_009649, partial [Gossypium schwendimanii]|nr:hypothetical protein [Gossypium schwendimanii]
ISSSILRKPYALEEACTVWEGILIDRSKRRIYFNRYAFRYDQHNIEITLGRCGQLARAAGAVAKLIAKEGKSAILKLPSGEKSLGRSGSKCWLGKLLVVRGVVMNPVDHPHGSGEGRAPIGRKKSATLGVILHLEEE